MFLTKDKDGTLRLWGGSVMPIKGDDYWMPHLGNHYLLMAYGFGDDMKEISWEDEKPTEIAYNDELYLKFMSIHREYEFKLEGNKNEVNMWVTRDNVSGLVLRETAPIKVFNRWDSYGQKIILDDKLFPMVSVEDKESIKIKIFIDERIPYCNG